jgi:hypothetical protein
VVEIVLVAEQDQTARRNATPPTLHEVELSPVAKPDGWAEPRGHRRNPYIDATDLRGTRNRQALATLRAAPLQNPAAVLRAHLHEEAVGPPATAAIGLERAFHETPSRVSLHHEETRIVANGGKPCQRPNGRTRSGVVCKRRLW